MADESHRKWKTLRPSERTGDGLVLEDMEIPEPVAETTSSEMVEGLEPNPGREEETASDSSVVESGSSEEEIIVSTPVEVFREMEPEPNQEMGYIQGLPDTVVEADSERILIVLPTASTSRLVRETLESFTDADVIVTSNALRGFELALQRTFYLFLFGMECGELTGPMLYELISKAYASGHGPKRLAPAVIFVRETDDPKLPEELANDARVKGIVSKPIRIERLLKAIEGSVEILDPTMR